MKNNNTMEDKILNYIIEYISEHGYPPSFFEIGNRVGLKSKSSVHNYMHRMIDNGVLESDCDYLYPRAIRVAGYKFVKQEGGDSARLTKRN